MQRWTGDVSTRDIGSIVSFVWALSLVTLLFHSPRASCPVYSLSHSCIVLQGNVPSRSEVTDNNAQQLKHETAADDKQQGDYSDCISTFAPSKVTGVGRGINVQSQNLLTGLFWGTAFLTTGSFFPRLVSCFFAKASLARRCWGV